MQAHTPKRGNPATGIRFVPLMLGSFFATVTGFVLFKDVIDGAAITIAHASSLAVIIGTGAAGYYAIPEFRRSILSSIVLMIVFVAGSLYLVVTSGARNAEVAASRVAVVATANKARSDLEAELTKARKAHGEAQAAFQRECATGKGKRCEGTQTAAEALDSHVALIEARLQRMRPAEVENGGYRHAAKVIVALIGSGDADALAERFALVMPFIAVLVNEVLAIVFVHMALPSPATVRLVSATVSAATSGNHLPIETAQTSFPATVADASLFTGDQPDGSDPSGPKGGNRRRKPLPSNVVDFRSHPVVAALEKAGGTVASNQELARLMGVTPGEASKRVREVSGQLDLARSGRELRISLRR